MSITKLVLVSKTGGTSKSWWCCYSTTTPFQAWLINKHRANLMKLSILIIIAHNFKIKFASQKKYNWQSAITKRNNAISHGVWKSQKKVAFNNASEASYIFIQKFENSNATFWVITKQCVIYWLYFIILRGKKRTIGNMR